VNFGAIPFSHVGSTTVDARAGFEFRLAAHETIRSTFQVQKIGFDRTDVLDPVLLGGHLTSWDAGYRRTISSRISAGVDYGFRRAVVAADTGAFTYHSVQAAVDYALSPDWTVTGGAGLVRLVSADPASRTAPTLRVGISRQRTWTRFEAAYVWSFIPSFAFGGTVRNHEILVGYRTPLFNSRHWYTDQSAVFRDNPPIVPGPRQLRLRSLRTNSVLGWTPRSWLSIEVFYTRVQQTSLQPGGGVGRNRIGVQVVTATPVRFR
jgi:hypothetical protein